MVWSLVSPYLNPAIEDNRDISPVPWMMTLPSITAAHLEREHKLTPEAMAPVIAYTRGEYAADLLKGRSDPGGDAAHRETRDCDDRAWKRSLCGGPAGGWTPALICARSSARAARSQHIRLERDRV